MHVEHGWRMVRGEGGWGSYGRAPTKGTKIRGEQKKEHTPLARCVSPRWTILGSQSKTISLPTPHLEVVFEGERVFGRGARMRHPPTLPFLPIGCIITFPLS